MSVAIFFDLFNFLRDYLFFLPYLYIIQIMQQDTYTIESTQRQLDTKRCIFSARKSQTSQTRSKIGQQTPLQELAQHPQSGSTDRKYQQSKLKHKITQNIPMQNSQDKNRGIRLNIGVVRRVSEFIQNLKRSVVQSKNSLDPLELFYLQNQSGQGQAQQQSVIAWDNIFLLIFQGVFSIGLLIGVWLCNYEAIFQKTEIGNFFYSVIFASYFLSIVITLNTEVKTIKLQVISKKTEIITNYIKNQAIYEGIALVSLLLVIANVPYLYYPARILFMASVKTIQRISMKIQDKYAASNSMENWISIIKFIFNIITFLHFLSIIFNALHLIQKQSGTTFTWVENNNLQGQSNLALYIGGYYWAATIISTVGFGDFTPGNSLQRGIISFVMIFCCLFFGYCLNVIGTLIGALGQSTDLYQKDIRKLNRYLKTIKIPKDLQDKIKQHFYNRYQIQQVYDQHTETYLLNKLTDQLQSSISQTSNIQILGKSTQMNFLTKKSKILLTNVMKKQIYAPGQVIFDQRTKQVKLLLVGQGNIGEYCFDRVNQTSLKGKKPIAKYSSADNTIGWTNFVTGNKYKSSAKAQNYSLVYQISQEDFFQIIRKNPRDLMKFMQVRQKYLQKKNKFKKACLVCNKFTHNVIDCPKIHFTPRPLQFMFQQIKVFLSKKNSKRNSRIYRKNKRQSHRLCLQQNQDSFDLPTIGQQQNQAFSGTITQRTESFNSNSQNSIQNKKKLDNVSLNSIEGQEKKSAIFIKENLNIKPAQKPGKRNVSIIGLQQLGKLIANSVQKKTKLSKKKQSMRECRQFLVDNSLSAQKLVDSAKKSSLQRHSIFHNSPSLPLHADYNLINQFQKPSFNIKNSSQVLKPSLFNRKNSNQVQKSSLFNRKHSNQLDQLKQRSSKRCNTRRTDQFQSPSLHNNKSSNLIEYFCKTKSTERQIAQQKYQILELITDAVMLQGNSNFFPEYNISKIAKKVNSKAEKGIEIINSKIKMNNTLACTMKRIFHASY